MNNPLIELTRAELDAMDATMPDQRMPIREVENYRREDGEIVRNVLVDYVTTEPGKTSWQDAWMNNENRFKEREKKKNM